MVAVIAYVVSGSGGSPTVVTPVDTATHTAGSPIVLAKGGQSIAATPNLRRVCISGGCALAVRCGEARTLQARALIPRRCKFFTKVERIRQRDQVSRRSPYLGLSEVGIGPFEAPTLPPLPERPSMSPSSA